MPVLAADRLIADRVDAIRDYHERAGLPRAQLDLSGGIDSAVSLALLVEALGPQAITLVYSGITSSPESRDRARTVADRLGVPLLEVELSSLYQELLETLTASVGATYDGEVVVVRDRIAGDRTILGSIRSTLRAPVGRAFNRLLGGGIRHGTGNECEDRWLRFYQKGGDGEVDTNPLAIFAKGEVYQLGHALGVPRVILEALPTPDLWGEGDAHNDEDEIGDFFELRGCGHTFYSYTDARGEYSSVGLIERTSRLLDEAVDGVSVETLLFADECPEFDPLIARAVDSPAFAGVEREIVDRLLRGARRLERATRHKWNPNCPTLGERRDLVEAGLLTDELPAISRRPS